MNVQPSSVGTVHETFNGKLVVVLRLRSMDCHKVLKVDVPMLVEVTGT
jgi:hypothetical protein